MTWAMIKPVNHLDLPQKVIFLNQFGVNNIHTTPLRWCHVIILIILSYFWRSLAHHIGQLSQGLYLPKDCEQVMQMYATHCTDDLRGYSWCVLNYSLRSPVTRRSLCTHVNPPPRRYLCLFCLRHVSSVQKFPRAERVSLPFLLTVVFCIEWVFYGCFMVWCFS